MKQQEFVNFMNIFNIENAFKLKKERGWDTIYWMIDLHNTVFPGKYESDQEFSVYPNCLKVLKYISNRNDMKIIVWTSSYAKHYDAVKDYFRHKSGIIFDYHNENPECGNTEYADFSTKPYFNILIDDKAGFCGESDWFLIEDELKRIGEW